MIPDHKPSRGFWLTVVLVAVLIGYPLSFGPVCWITSHLNAAVSSLPTIYRPMTWAMTRNDVIDGALNRYAEFGAAQYWHWVDFSDPAIKPHALVWAYLPPY